ncbi:MAG: c-type cytochrome [Gaiellaceae bacterium]
MAPRKRRNPWVATGEVLMWLLFVALLVPAGAVGWAIGHYTGHHGGTRTVTVSAAAAPATTSSPAVTSSSTPTVTLSQSTATAPAPAAAAGDAAKGKTVFLGSGCGACHTFKPAGSSAKIGPDLDTQPAIDAPKANQPLAAFLRESIVKPNAYISPGFPKSLMPGTFGSSLSKTQLADLVAFLQAK